MHRQLIEALRAEAAEWNSWTAPASAGDLQSILNGVADRLEGASDCSSSAAETRMTGCSCETAPTSYMVSGTPCAGPGSVRPATAADEEKVAHDRKEMLKSKWLTEDVITSLQGMIGALEERLRWASQELHERRNEAPDDSDEPLTAEWLDTVQPGYLAVDSGIALDRLPLIDRTGLRLGEAGAILEHVTTRGEYRSLRKMLGIPMEEGK